MPGFYGLGVMCAGGVAVGPPSYPLAAAWGTSGAPAVCDEFRDSLGNGFAGHVGGVLLFVELRRFGECHARRQCAASGRVIAHHVNQTGGADVGGAFIFGEQHKGLLQ